MKQTNEISNMNQSTQHPNFDISAWMDGDTETEMPESLLKLQGQETWALYHLIGDTLRTPEISAASTRSLGQRISEQVKNEPEIIARAKPVAASTKKMRIWGQSVWPGFAMAAAVASVIWVAKPFLLPELSISTEQVAQATQAPVVSVKEVAFNTPIVNDYVSAHRQISGLAHASQASYGAAR